MMKTQRVCSTALLLLFLCSFSTRTTSSAQPVPHKEFAQPCSRPQDKARFAFCNATLSHAERIQDLLQRLTDAEKISLLGNSAHAVPRLGLPSYQWWGEALHGVARYFTTKVTSTSFPQVQSLSNSFNTTLFGDIGRAIAQQAVYHTYILHDVAQHTLTYWTPNVNLFRDPRWGRGQETPGEDPYLTAEYVSALVPALQEPVLLFAESTNRSHRISAACKHYYAYSIEDHRLSFNARIDNALDERDYLSTFFVSCVQRAKATGIMCSYNAVNGVPNCANPELLTKHLRHNLGFDGYVTGDCGAVEFLYTRHNFTQSPEETVRVALEAGVDVDCGTFVQDHGVSALQQNILQIDTVHRALSNLFRTQLRLGYFDPIPTRTTNVSAIESAWTDMKAWHNELALDAARQAVVLLKNQDSVLPLSQSLQRNVLLIGPNANATTTLLGNYHGYSPLLISPLQGLQSMGVNVTYIKGCEVNGDSVDQSFPHDVCQVTESGSVDAVVMIMGLNQSIESEGLDRKTLTLPQGQNLVILSASQCAKQSNVPVVLIMVSGGPVDVSPYKTSNQIDSILFVGYPGQAGGQAVAEAIYGKINPSGKLTTSIMTNDFAMRVKLQDMRLRPADDFPGRTYRFCNDPRYIVYPFGYGLSYSTFQIRSAEYNDATVSMQVFNAGPMDGAVSVLVFHIPEHAGQEGNPIQDLVGFDKVFLGVGELQKVLVHVDGGKKTGRFVVGTGNKNFVEVTQKRQSRSVKHTSASLLAARLLKARH